MKVLHVTPSIAKSYGGPTQSLGGYIAAARLRGAHVTVAAPAGTSEEADAIESIAGAGNVHTFKTFGRAAFVMSPDLVKWVSSEAPKHDVVHVHGLFNPVSTLSARAAIGVRAPVIIRPFGTLSRYTFEHRRSILKQAYFAAIERSNLQRAAGLHFTTTTESDEAKWHGLDFGGRSYIVPPPWIADSAPREKSSVSRTALFIGRLNKVKNLEALIDAWPIVARRHADAKLIIAGTGDNAYISELEARIAQHDPGESITFAGFLSGDAKSNALAISSILVLPSHHENFGVVVLEAIGAGLPVVVSPHVQLADFVKAEGLGIVTGTDAAAFASAIIDAFDDQALHNRVRETGREILARDYSPAVVGKMLEQMYLESAASNKRKTSSSTTE
jgi:glycosyltransferase involved in cell wall biosynthesis